MEPDVREPKAWAKTLRLKLQQRARTICKTVGAVLGFNCVCRICAAFNTIALVCAGGSARAQ
jgi:hypothetical protein